LSYSVKTEVTIGNICVKEFLNKLSKYIRTQFASPSNEEFGRLNRTLYAVEAASPDYS